MMDKISHVIFQRDRRCMYKCNIETCSHDHRCRRKAISITYSERVFVVFVIQHAMCMHRIVLLCVACLDLPYFAT